jgi:multidrug resistance efflux pump
MESNMPTAFTHTFRALHDDRPHVAIAGILAASLLAFACAAWALYTPVRLYEATSSARLEVERAIYPIASPVAGRVTVVHLTLGREVTEGEILVEIDSAAERLQIREDQARQAALRTQMEALRAQIVSEDRARGQERQASGVGQEQARADARESDLAAGHAEADERRMAQLHREGLIAERDYEKAKSEALTLRAAAQARAIGVDRAGEDQGTRDGDRAAKIQSLDSQIVGLEAQIPEFDAAIARLKYDIERHDVRAPASGKLGEALSLRPGAIVKDGEKLGAIIPGGRIKALAQFPPDAALGRIHAGQLARLRLDGFPWIEYGTVTARVDRVAGEVRDGMVRVELALDPGQNTRIPLQHGLPGTAEIEVERTTPWQLLRRHAGSRSSALQGEENR